MRLRAVVVAAVATACVVAGCRRFPAVPVNAGVDAEWNKPGSPGCSAGVSQNGPVDANHFMIPGTPIAVEFIPAAAGRVQQVRVTGEG